MSLIEMLNKAVEEEYVKRQEERYAMLDGKMITSSEVAGMCEKKFLYSRRNPEIKPDRSGIATLMHGTMLHEYFEGLLNDYFPHLTMIEGEYSVPIGGEGYRLVGHIDVLAVYDPKNKVLYDFKTANPYQYMKVKESGKPKLQHKYQMHIYKYLLERSGIKIDEMRLIYINKSRMSFTRKGEGRTTVEELEMTEVPVEYDGRLVKVLLSHARDMLTELNHGIEGRDVKETIEKMKEYYEQVGLDTEEIEKENFPKWMCDYCRYKDMCMEREKVMSEEQEKGKENEIEMGD